MRYPKTYFIAFAIATTIFYSSTSISVEKYEIYAYFPSKWSSNTIPVCWENPSFANAEGRKWTIEAIKETWERYSSLQFTGWARCHNRSMGIRILIDDDGPHTKGLGNQLDGRRNGMVLNFTFNDWIRSCRRSLYFCVKVIAVHEFGHALGFAHEQNRPDAPRECQKERQGGDGDVYLSGYDPYSVMNYCNPRWNGGGTLSNKDIEGLQKWYGLPKDKPNQPTRYGNTDENTEGIYPQASTRLLTHNDLGSLSKWQLKIMRNEIFARHGYIFHTAAMKNYFNQQSWYQPKYNDVSHLLTPTESKNIKLIQQYEN